MPVGVAQKLEKLQCNFLWGDEIEKRKLHAVDWISVCKSKAKGGLGIGRMIDKNEGLLTKWVWRFGREESPLWKKVLRPKYAVKGSEVLWNWQSNVTASFFVKTIANLFKPETKYAILIKEGFKVVIGCGDKADFWNDIKVGERPLKEVFSRMYALAVEKEGQVKKFGNWDSSIWRWEIKLRRLTFDWEKEQWNNLLSFLGGITIRNSVKDSIAWKFSSNGLFSVGSFRMRLDELDNEDQWLTRSSWHGFCPHKVEVFAWQLLRNRVLVREVLQRFGCLQDSSLVCPLCNNGIESINHLFLHCHWTWDLWTRCMGWWNVSSCSMVLSKIGGRAGLG
ncbi:hypothetical protein Dsin_002532 [Dipteronia sinensis]|uniref:Reverse transcriptase zinc-binding domain-containing protein n=1 Tax=Dipteronia sinensis TaxID=43782 RepID=A0AAE0B5Y3_9ROSI|nr:hypothetical protein Dsin_002532 [Dipteronia sinensis]